MADEKRLISVEKTVRELENEIYWTDSTKAAIRAFLRTVPAVNAVEVKCKVGDWVYALWEAPVKLKYIIYCAEVKEIRISMRNCRLTTTYILEPIEFRGRRKEYRDDDFGKLVFLEQDQAENVLNGERNEKE